VKYDPPGKLDRLISLIDDFKTLKNSMLESDTPLFSELLSRVLPFLNSSAFVEDVLLIGGVALSVFDVPRNTKDIGLLIKLKRGKTFSSFYETVKSNLDKYAIYHDKILADPIIGMIDLMDTQVQFFEFNKVYENLLFSSAKDNIAFNHKIKVPSIEDLIVSKLKAGLTADLVDAAVLLNLPGANIRTVKSISNSLNLADKLDKAITISKERR
jgi:hypothetical protein